MTNQSNSYIQSGDYWEMQGCRFIVPEKWVGRLTSEIPFAIYPGLIKQGKGVEMDLEEFQQRKRELENDIALVLENLSKNSGLLISDIYVVSHPIEIMGEAKPVKYQYNVKIKVVI